MTARSPAMSAAARASSSMIWTVSTAGGSRAAAFTPAQLRDRGAAGRPGVWSPCHGAWGEDGLLPRLVAVVATFCSVSTSAINTALARLLRRAEGEDARTLVETFVDVGTLYARLSSRDDQVLFGRRGTGKTHALSFLAGSLRAQDQTAVYVDLRLLGSSGGIYSDAGISVEEAGTRLLLDALHHIYDELLENALEGPASDSAGGDQLLTRLEALGTAISQVSVIGETEQRTKTAVDAGDGTQFQVGGDLASSGPRLRAFARFNHSHRLAAEREVLLRGVARHRVHFGAVGTALRRLVPSLPGRRLWLLLDEWSHIPMHLQPLLADLLRHCVLPVPGVTVKIAAIDQRSVFQLPRNDGSYVGIELGADIAADIDLDEFMVFSNDHDRAVAFFAQLFHRHIAAISAQYPGGPSLASPSAFVSEAFVNKGAFHELVRAAEGVPRDAINIVSKAALHAGGERIAIRDVREAARTWYMMDKEAGLQAKRGARALLHWIIDRVIGQRQVRAFLLQQGSESHLIDWLYDARLLHVVKRGIASKDLAGVRFDAYALDYGCYVDLLATRRAAPRGLLRTADNTFLDVPPDDLDDRMRSAILDLAAFLDPEEESLRAMSLTRVADLPPLLPDVEFRGRAAEDHRYIDRTDDLSARLASSGWYLVIETRHGIAAVPMGKRTLRIGSSSNADIRIKHTAIAPRLAYVLCKDGTPQLVAEQGGSMYVNHRRVRGSTVLEDRDHVMLGPFDLLIVEVPDPQ